jgi:cell division inhibitor SepF
MGFMEGVWRLLGADDHEDDNEEAIVDYQSHERAPVQERSVEAGASILHMPQDSPRTTVYVVKPQPDAAGSYNFSLRAYAQHLLSHHALVVDVNELADIDIDEATRVVDYLSGVVEAVDGTVYEITRNIFIFAPDNVELAGDPLKQVEVY